MKKNQKQSCLREGKQQQKPHPKSNSRKSLCIESLLHCFEFPGKDVTPNHHISHTHKQKQEVPHDNFVFLLSEETLPFAVLGVSFVALGNFVLHGQIFMRLVINTSVQNKYLVKDRWKAYEIRKLRLASSYDMPCLPTFSHIVISYRWLSKVLLF